MSFRSTSLFAVIVALCASVALAQAPAPAAPATPATPAAPAKPANAPKETPELVAKGKAAFAMTCVVCHGEKGDGNGPAGAAMDPKPRDFSKEPFKNGYKVEDVFGSISSGVKDTAMVGFNGLPEEDRWAMSYYVLTLVPAELKKPGKGKKGTKAAAPATPATPATPAEPAPK